MSENSDRSAEILVCGSTTARTSFAILNRWLIDGLADAGYRVAQVDKLAEAQGFAGTVILSDFSEHFGEVRRPEGCRHFIAFRTWDFGPYPPRWVEKINRDCDQLWVYGTGTRVHAVSSGIDPHRIHVVPLGADTTQFNTDGPALPLDTEKRLRFLFVGGAIFRKGMDILLDTYMRTFTADDDVSLVVHSHEDELFYKGIAMHEQVESLAESGGPEIMLHTRFLSLDELAGLYRACDVGIYPYRAEGYAIPIVEGMACGMPPVVPDYGPVLDYTSPETAYRVRARRMSLPVRGSFVTNTLGFKEAINEIEFCEVDRAELGARLRAIYEGDPKAITQRGRRAAESVQAGHTLTQMVDAALMALHALPD